MSSISNMLRRGPASLDAEREAFEKNQMMSIQKAMSTVECAAKEKHIRNTILGTFHEKGARTFWHVVRRQPLSHQSIVAWKFCHVLHKVLRDGHPNALKDSLKYRPQVQDLAKNWGHFPQGYGELITLYLKALSSRMDFHEKYESFPGNLAVSDEEMEKLAGNDINAYFALCVDVLDCIETQMQLQQKVFTTLDMSRAISMTGAGQCRLSPCIPLILDTSQLYDYSVKILFKLHSCLPPDTLSGHRERFKGCYIGLKKFYHICSNLQYFKRLIQVPSMPENMPDFFIQSDGSHQLGPVRMVEDIEPDRSPSPEPSTVGQLLDTNFDDIFGSDQMNFSFNNGAGDQAHLHDPRDEHIKSLQAEIERLKAEIELMQAEHSDEVRHLLAKLQQMQAEMETSQVIAQDSHSEVEKLKQQLVTSQLQAEHAVKQHSLLQDVEKRAVGNEEMYKKLKEKHMALVQDHAHLLRKHADTQRQTEIYKTSVAEHESTQSKFGSQVAELEDEILRLRHHNEDEENRRKSLTRNLLELAVGEAREMITYAMTSLDDDDIGVECSSESLMRIIERADQSADRMGRCVQLFTTDSSQVESVVQTLASFGHYVAFAISHGAATCNMVPDHSDELKEACRKCGRESTDFLDLLLTDPTSSHVTNVKLKLQAMLNSARDLLPSTGADDSNLHDMVEQEMLQTTQAVEQAAERIQLMLNEARSRDSGVKLEVNERILDACTDLMKFIRMLIQSSKELQREIVEQGRGAASPKEFYMKNSRWTEGLISAAKAVGWGATMLTDAADLVVQGEGKLEELMVCSHEISASTAQLVAASRVKAMKGSAKLTKLQSASRDVNGATARVVACTNHGRQQLDHDSDTTDYSSHTLTQIKRREMDSQVRVLELEQALQQERIKLGSLRKKHYELAGAKSDDEDDDVTEPQKQEEQNNNGSGDVTTTSQKPQITLPKPALPPKPATAQ